MYDSYASNASTFFIGFIFFVLLCIYIQVLLIRWVFKIQKQLANQRAMVWLLMKLCEKAGVSAEEVNAIATSNGVK